MAQYGILHITKTYKTRIYGIPKPSLKQEICTAVMTIAAIQNAIMTNSAKQEQHANLDGKSCRRSSFDAPLAKRELHSLLVSLFSKCSLLLGQKKKTKKNNFLEE